MTAIVSNLDVKISPTPFCDQSCKGIRVIGQFVGRSLYALVLLIASVACRIFSRDLGDRYLSMARAQFVRGTNGLYTYFKYGKALIDFSYNGCVIAPASGTEQKALRARYGSDVIDRWLQIGTREIPLNLENLKRKEGGICLGMSLDFMKHCLQRIQRGMSPLDAIREISSRYVAGAPDEAQLAQTFYSALDTTHAVQEETVRLDAVREESLKEIARKKEEVLQKCLIRPGDDPRKKLAQTEIELKQLNDWGQNLLASDLSQQIEATPRVAARRHEMVSQQFGLQMGLPRIYAHQEMPAEHDTHFNEFLKALPEGSYLGILCAEKSGHAISLIKAGDRYFLFDPNLGTVAFDASSISEKLWDIAKTFYLKNGLSTLAFSPCTLR